MHLLYLDDSGSAANQNEAYLVLGGLCVYEAQAAWFTQQLNQLAETLSPEDPASVEFHASEVFSGRTAPWKSLDKTKRIEVIRSVLRVLGRSYDTARAFACAVHKPSFKHVDPMELAFEDLCSRFDLYLKRRYTAGERDHRGLIILDKSSYETSLQGLAREFRSLGTRWGIVIRNLADTPLFVDSRASRLVQLADSVAYAVFRRYEAGDTSYFDLISSKFDSDGGRLHGLIHKQTNDPTCMCPACMSRRLIPPAARQDSTPW